MLGLVDVYVQYFDGNQRWYVSCLGHAAETGDEQPSDFDDLTEFRTKELALNYARCTAKYAVSAKQAKKSVIFVGDRSGMMNVSNCYE